MMTKGVLYIASGSEYIREATESAKSVKKHTNLPTTIVSDREVIKSCFDTVIQSDDFCYHYGDSVLQIPELPYEKTLLLDTDTILSDEIDELFDIIDRFDIASSTIADGEFELADKVPKSFPEYNTGVILFKRNKKTREFIEEWKTVYRTYLDNGVRMNQPAFRETLYRSSLRIATLPTEYNCRANFGGYLNSKVKILHGEFEDPDHVMNKLNEYEVPRLFFNTPDSLQIQRIERINTHVFG